MACVALSCLMSTIELEFLQPIPRVSLSEEDAAVIKSFFDSLSSLQAFLPKESNGAIKDLEIKIREFALKAEDAIEIQLSNFLLAMAKDRECEDKASNELHQILREAAEKATELLNILNNTTTITNEVEVDDEANESIHDFESDGSLLCHPPRLLDNKMYQLKEGYDCRYQQKMMACVALTCLMSTIKLEFLQPVTRVSLSEETPIKSLFDSLSSLQAFLEKESRRGGDGAKVSDLEIKIRDFAFKAEDDIEIQIRNFLLPYNTECEDNASQELHQILGEAAEKAAEFLNILNTTTISDEGDEVNEYIKWSMQDFELDVSLCQPPRLDNKMVGRDDDYATIMYQLEEGYGYRYQQKMMWIVGMPGIGNTTLAASVYTDPIVKAYFEVRVWITMPQKYNHREILCILLLSIAASATETSEFIKSTPSELAQPSEIIKSTPCELADQLRKHLKGKRFLIVLDNFWKSEAWDDIIQLFPDDYNRSRILVTTTHFDRDCYTSSYYYIHNMTLLNSTNSWDVFCNILSRKEHMPPKFEKIGSREIVEKCDGLPQVIVAVAKRLSRCNNIQQEAKRIEKELDSIGILDRTALTFVFNQLPLHLKVCFLYLGVFPKRKEILVKMLIGLWCAEGFVKSECEAYSYLQELIDRSLVLIGKRSSDGKSKTCRIHSSLHSFCVGEAQKEGIFCAVNTQKHLGLPLDVFANSCRWLSFYTHSFDYYVLFSTNISRSVLFFDDNPEMFAPSNLLRVLAFVSPPFLQRIPKHLGNLVFLRYLSVTQWFEGLGDIVSANPNLQTLVVSHSESQHGAPSLIHLPSTIWEPPHLRHLELSNMYTVDPPSLLKQNLQALSWVVTPTHCGKGVYFNLPDLRKLKIFCKEDLEPSETDGCSSNHTILDNSNNILLERLTIWVSMGCTTTLPKVFPSQLKKLKLSGTNLSETDLRVIGRLPQLEYLKLQNVSFGRVWRVAKGGFLKLRFLLLEDKELQQLMVEEESFPSLESIVLRCCHWLDHIPYHFASSPYLKSIEFDMCLPCVIASAKVILEVRRQQGYNISELIIDGAKSVETKLEEVFVGEALTDIGGFTVEAAVPTKLLCFVAGLVIYVIWWGSFVSRLPVITSLWLPSKGKN